MSLDTVAPPASERAFDVWGGRLSIRVRVTGTGAPLLYMPSTGGPSADPFLSHLAERHTVYVPEFPGTSLDDPYAGQVVDDLPDLVLAYEAVVRRLGLRRPAIVGHSFGGMLAAELAAYFPALTGKLVLLDPVGLWRDDAPVVNLSAVPMDQLPGLLFHDPRGEAAQAALALPGEPEAARAAIAARMWAAGCTGRFVWPIPDRGLRGRLHRIIASTLMVWGAQDRVVPASYGAEFAASIGDSQLVVIDDCGHIPQVERYPQTAAAIDAFLAE